MLHALQQTTRHTHTHARARTHTRTLSWSRRAAQVLRCIGARMSAELPLLQGLDEDGVGLLATMLRRAAFPEGDVIYTRGEPAAEAYFVTPGAVRIAYGGTAASTATLCRAASVAGARHAHAGGIGGSFRSRFAAAGGGGPAGTAEREVRRGEAFGEAALFPDLLGGVRPETAVALSWVDAYALPAAAAAALRERRPDLLALLRPLCELRAVEVLCRDPDAAAGGGGGGGVDGGEAMPCMLTAMAAQLQTGLLRMREAQVREWGREGGRVREEGRGRGAWEREKW